MGMANGNYDNHDNCGAQLDALGWPGVVGDGLHDDTTGLQAALDGGARTVCLPRPPGHYSISAALKLHSGQTLQLDRSAVVRLADHGHAHMLTNADHERGNRGISVIGGIWDGNNAHQTCAYHETGAWQVPYDPARYLGVLLQFSNVEDLRIANLTLKDPETFGVQMGNIRRFTVEDITFDYNLLRLNMDGIHVHGNSHQGRITNLKGNTNDDLVALNADDGSMFELSRGAITDVTVDGVFAECGCTAVRLLSAGSPVSRVRLANIHGSYRYNVVSFTHHDVHPGEASVFEDIVLDGVFCSKPTGPLPGPLAGNEGGRATAPLIWVAPGTLVRGLHIRNMHRTEKYPGAPDSVVVDEGATVEYLGLSDVSLTNRTDTPLALLRNAGTITALNVSNAYLKAVGGAPRGCLIRNSGCIESKLLTNVAAENLASVEE